MEEISGICHKKRYAYRKEKEDNIYIFCHEENSVSKQVKWVSGICVEGYLKAELIAKSFKSDLNDFEAIALHNVRKHTASLGQKIGNIIGEDGLSSAQDKLGHIKNSVKSNINSVAKELLTSRKLLEQMEFDFIMIESLTTKIGLQDLTAHKAHHLVKMAYYLHEEEILKKHRVNIATYDGKILCDFGSARSAISQIFSNAIKYCKNNEQINVVFVEDGDFVSICFEMVSLYFSSAEAVNLTQKGYRGINTKNIDGKGIGLYAVSHFMEMNHGYMDISSSEATKFHSGENHYSTNRFVLSFKKSSY
ncbi:MAG: hypothetical protein R3E61_03590 [Pseudomonadales bacterium]